MKTPKSNNPMTICFRVFMRYFLRASMAIYLLAMEIGRFVHLPKKKIDPNRGVSILLTGTFYSDNWLLPHITPLAMSKNCTEILMVSSRKVPVVDKVQGVYPPAWLSKIMGATNARLVTFVCLALRKRPQVIGGFHLLLNGLCAALLARFTGARSLYICGGGPREVQGGGYATENRLFNKIGAPDTCLERQLLKSVNNIDLVITMGSRAVKFFKENGVSTCLYIVPGGFDGVRFRPSDKPTKSDMVLVGRLSEVKRVDVFLNAIALIKNDFPSISATIVGDGPLRKELEVLAKQLGITQNVNFVGHQEDVKKYLSDNKIFVLTSASEGLSLAMMEAMLCGLVPVVSNVGDLGDMVEDGVNGFLVSYGTSEQFSQSVMKLLKNKKMLESFGEHARAAAMKHEMANVSRTWDDILNFQHS